MSKPNEYYINGSIAVSIPITIDGVAIATSYAAGATMSNPAAGYGICRATVYTQAGIVATSNGVPLLDVTCYRDAAESGRGDLVISFGLQIAGEFEVAGVYGVKKLDGTLDWRELERQHITVVPMKANSGKVLSPNMTIA